MKKLNYLFITIPLHPLLFITAAYAVGVAFEPWITISLLSVISTVSCLLYFLLAKKIKAIRLSMLLGLIPLAIITGAYRFNYQKKQHKKLQDLIQNQTIDIIATIESISSQQAPSKYCIVLADCKIKKTVPLSPWVYIKQNFVIRCSKKPCIQNNDVVLFCAIKSRKNENSNFDFYSLKENIGSTFFSMQLNYTVLQSANSSLSTYINNYKDKLVEDFRKKLNPLTFALYMSIFFGYKPENKKILNPTKNYCRIWGLSHFLARSGLHLIIFIALLYTLFNMMQFSITLKSVLLMIISYIYFILSYPSISFIRAILTFFLYETCLLLKIKSSSLYLITLVCLSVLIYNPAHLFFLDFQLSFILTYALAWFNLLHKRKLLISHSSIAS